MTKEAGSRNKYMDILLGLGVIYVVLGHSDQPKIFSLPAYTFHVALFFFVSGYFFRRAASFTDKLKWIKNKFFKLLIPYFILNFLFLILTFAISKQGIKLGTDFSIGNFFLTPFTSGQQYHLFLAAWFVPQLFIVHALAQFIIIRNNKYFLFILTAASIIISGFLMSRYKNQLSGWELTAARSMFGLSFYLMGYVFQGLEGQVKKYLVTFESFVFLFILYVSLETFFGGLKYTFAFWDFSNTPIVTYLATISAILMLYIISNTAANTINNNSFIYLIGQNTFSIMAFHILIFFIINCALCFFGIIPKTNLNNIFFQFNQTRWWFAYVVPGVFIPTILSIYFKNYLLSKKISWAR